ncbi:3-deoxy-manno-octulosonate cytidylyltransferase [Candidatus Pelagibacter communis]|uniref:3-deoxy-manno-octulosonate cytidylyltransferase n=1 Tax=Pelagibacter ubique TaxID=198252 RepID=UPI00094CA7BE|nr:3-deoxy-manno-octulosonate cytidylyltransferase [Candidatus Pelagibacter ubique]
MKKIILIPSRLKSSRLPSKALLEIDSIPIIIHTYMRAKLSKFADDVFVCTDSKLIQDVCKKFDAKSILTKKKHKNGTERIFEAAKKLKLKNNDIIIDVQGDEPLIDPISIDKTANFFLKNNFEIVVPHIIFSKKNKQNIVKLIVNDQNEIKWMTRSDTPFEYLKKTNLKKHLSIIIFTFKSLQKYNKLKPSYHEKIESIELLRALENGISMGSNKIKSDSFSIDILEDYQNALRNFKRDKIKKKYKKWF